MYGPCLSAIVGGHALTPPIRRSLGRPLPHQLADRCRATPPPILRSLILRPHAVLPRLSTSYPTEKGMFPAYTHPSATDFVRSTKITNLCFNCLRQIIKNTVVMPWRKQMKRIIIFVLHTISVRLACLRHAASVHPEPGSNSQKN